MSEQDQHQGEGGAYVMRDGQRVRVEEPTKDHPEGNRARDASGKPIDATPVLSAEEKPAPPAGPKGPRRLASVDQ
jgi:hypothetical protein